MVLIWWSRNHKMGLWSESVLMEKLSASFVKVPPRAHLLNLVTSTATEKYIFIFIENIYINARNMFFSSKKSNFSARCSSQFATENQDWSLIHLDLHLILITILALRHFAINYQNRTRRKGRINRRQAKGPDQLSSMSGAFSHFGNPFRIKDPEILFQINLFIKGSFENGI